MAFTPSNPRMNPLNGVSTLRLTPQTRYLANQTPIKTVQDGSSLSLSLTTVIGTTTSSSSGFDCLPHAKSFALCAGSVVILAQLDEDLNVTQRFFRAIPTAAPVNATVSFYNPATPPGRSRPATSLRDGMFGSAPNVSSRRESMESPGKGMVHQRMKAATCLSLSPDATFLAVGETGYNPRVLIFSTALNAPQDIPLSSICEHTFGVRCVAFSPDARYLCSVGDTNDGFVYVWAIHPKTGSARLVSSNRCTANVRDISWIGNSLISVGTRHVKVWRLPQAAPASPAKTRFNVESDAVGPPTSPAPKTLAGRNCLLGPLLEAVFTCVAAISDVQAIVCTDGGEICLLDDSARTQQFEKVAKVGFSVACITIDRASNCVWIGGADGHTQALPLDTFSRHTVSESSRAESPFENGLKPPTTPGYVAMGNIHGHLITLDLERAIRFHHIDLSGAGPKIDAASKHIISHRSAVLGVSALHQPNDYSADFLTWSGEGSVMFWALNGSCKGNLHVELDSFPRHHVGDGNELKVVRACAQDNTFLSGDKFGVLRLLESASGKCISTIRAHTADINDITMVRRDDKLTLVGSCSRDRTIQIFKKLSADLSLLQTLDDHAGPISQLMFMNKGARLLSSSSDRTVMVRTLAFGADLSMAYVPTRILTLKASPVAFTTMPDDSDTLIISSMDRQIQAYEISTGRHINSIRTSDSEHNDAVVLNALAAKKLQNAPSRSAVVVGASSTDKSIRIYDYDNGSMLMKDHGHTEGVSDVKILQGKEGNLPGTTSIISTGLDGVIMVWELPSRSQRHPEADDPVDLAVNGSVLKLTNASDQPLRRILSRSELSEFQRGSEIAGDSAPQTTPNRDRSPSRLRRKTSRYALSSQPPQMTAPSFPTINPLTPPISTTADILPGIKYSRDRSPTPPTPKITGSTKPRRPSMDARHRTKSAGNLSDLQLTAEQLCKTLRAYRKKIDTSRDALNREIAQELERELGLTIHAISEKTRRYQAASEPMLGDLVDQYTEKLARMIDEKVAISVAKQTKLEHTYLGPDGTEEQLGSPVESVGEG